MHRGLAITIRYNVLAEGSFTASDGLATKEYIGSTGAKTDRWYSENRAINTLNVKTANQRTIIQQNGD